MYRVTLVNQRVRMSASRASQSGKHVTPMFNVCSERPRSDTSLALERSPATACLPDSLGTVQSSYGLSDFRESPFPCVGLKPCFLKTAKLATYIVLYML